MTDSPPFSGDRPRCTACGHRGAHTEWHPGYATVNMGPFLRRYCARCGFLWFEQLAPADDPQTDVRPTVRQRVARIFRRRATEEATR